MFKQSFNKSAVDSSSSPDRSIKTPAIGDKFKSSPSPPRVADEIPVDLEESEEYRDDDFDSSDGSAALQKATVTASGKLPPLSGSYPYGADDKSLS